MSERSLAYICAECGGFAYADCESLDTGTTLTCECGGKTVVNLQTTEAYCRGAKIEAEAKRLREEAEQAKALYRETLDRAVTAEREVKRLRKVFDDAGAFLAANPELEGTGVLRGTWEEVSRQFTSRHEDGGEEER